MREIQRLTTDPLKHGTPHSSAQPRKRPAGRRGSGWAGASWQLGAVFWAGSFYTFVLSLLCQHVYDSQRIQCNKIISFITFGIGK